MTVLTLEEFRATASEQELAAKPREEAFMIRGPYARLPKPGRESEPEIRFRLLALADRFLRLSFRAP